MGSARPHILFSLPPLLRVVSLSRPPPHLPPALCPTASALPSPAHPARPFTWSARRCSDTDPKPSSTVEEQMGNAMDPSRWNRPFGNRFSPSANTGAVLAPDVKPRVDVERMETTPRAPTAASPDKFQAKSGVLPLKGHESDTHPRLNASRGRSIDLNVGRGRDLVRGLAQLNMLVARNRIRSDVARQRFHERPGLKRKRLKSERWRKRFKIGFQGVVARVSQLTKKGW